MRIIAVDDEKEALESLINAIKAVAPNDECTSFLLPDKALDYSKKNKIDVAFLDINLPAINGVQLAEILKQGNKQINIIFVTCHDEYMKDAFSMHASGYVSKPITSEKVKIELDDLRKPIPKGKIKPILKACCFGNFDLKTMDGKSVYFERQKSKELFAYLIFRRGASCTIKEIASVLFEDDPYDTKVQAYIQKIISAMMKNLKAIGADCVIDKGYNALSVIIEYVESDYFEVLNNSNKASMYMGEFMSQYEWAEEFNAFFM